jgi:hypothetical protein
MSEKKLSLYFISLFFLSSLSGYAQDGVLIDYVGTTRDASAVLDVRSSSQGVLVPRISIPSLAAAAPVTLPATGLLVYNTNGATGVGYHYWTGSVWTRLRNGTTVPWSEITGTPTTLSGYGITDAVPASRNITLNSTANQTTVSATMQNLTADRTWTIGTVQDIATTSSPTFSNVTATGRFYGRLNVPDTRAVNTAPTGYNNEVSFDFKLLSALNSAPGSGNYGGLMTFAPWGDNSGDASHQLLLNEGGIFWRQGQPDAATWDSWSQILTTSAGGGGTTNYLARWTSANTLGIGATYDNGTNVGVNEASPNAPLSIRASNTSDQGLYQSWRYQANSDTYTLRLKQTVTSGVVRYTYDMVNNGTAYNNFLTFDRGNIGMGVTDPAAKLHVVGAAIVATSGNAAASRTLTIMENGDAYTAFGTYPGAWTSALQIQDNTSPATRFIWLSPLDNASGQNARLRTAGSGFDIYVGGGNDAGTLSTVFASNGTVRMPSLAGTGNRPVYADATGTLNTNNAGAAAGAATVVPMPLFGDDPIVSTTTWTRLTMTTYSGLAAYFAGVPVPAGATRKYFLVIRRADNQPGGIGSYWRFACDGGWNGGNDVAGHGFSLSSNWGSPVEGTMDWIEIPPTAVSGSGCGTSYWKIDARMANAGTTMRVMSISMAAMDVYGGTNAAYSAANTGNAIGPRTSTDFGYAPLGSIMAWHKNLSSTPGLPDGWVECNGQTISDVLSPYNGVAVPDLNSNVSSAFGGTSGGGRFLRGAATSGTMQADQMADIEMNGDNSSSSTSLTRNNDGSTSNYSAWFEYFYSGDRMRWRYANREVRPVAMTVVWIIRVK